MKAYLASSRHSFDMWKDGQPVLNSNPDQALSLSLWGSGPGASRSENSLAPPKKLLAPQKTKLVRWKNYLRKPAI